MTWSVVLAIAFVVQFASWLVLRYGFERALRHSERVAAATGKAAGNTPPDGRHSDTAFPPMSIVVAARNEAHRLPGLLAALTQQTHPHYEVIIVDDASSDDTAAVVRSWQQAHANVHLLRVDHPRHPRKKHALTQGIAAARFDLLALTDADCTPPAGWLAALARRHAAEDEDVVLIGYSPMKKARGVLNRLARYETLMTGFFTAAAAGLHHPYMAVGRNLSYSRRVFDRVGGFAHSQQSLSGDDDLFVQQVWRCRAATVRPVLDPDTVVPTEAPRSWRQWIRQKRRHLSAGRFYAPRFQVFLTIFHATSIAVWAAPFLWGLAGASLLIAKLLVQAYLMWKAARILGEEDLMPTQPTLELLYVGYNLVLAPLGIVHVPKRW